MLVHIYVFLTLGSVLIESGAWGQTKMSAPAPLIQSLLHLNTKGSLNSTHRCLTSIRPPPPCTIEYIHSHSDDIVNCGASNKTGLRIHRSRRFRVPFQKNLSSCTKTTCFLLFWRLVLTNLRLPETSSPGHWHKLDEIQTATKLIEASTSIYLIWVQTVVLVETTVILKIRKI